MDKVGVGKCNSALLKLWDWEIESVLWLVVYYYYQLEVVCCEAQSPSVFLCM